MKLVESRIFPSRRSYAQRQRTTLAAYGHDFRPHAAAPSIEEFPISHESQPPSGVCSVLARCLVMEVGGNVEALNIIRADHVCHPVHQNLILDARGSKPASNSLGGKSVNIIFVGVLRHSNSLLPWLISIRWRTTINVTDHYPISDERIINCGF